MSFQGGQKKRFKPFSALRSWWKRRRFQHLLEAGTHDEHEEENVNFSVKSEVTDENLKPSIIMSEPHAAPLALYFNAQPPRSRDSYPFQRSKTADSFQDSIESMDSVMDSHWDPDNEENSQTDQVHEVHGDAYLLEHLNFLSISTQPQEVELMHGG